MTSCLFQHLLSTPITALSARVLAGLRALQSTNGRELQEGFISQRALNLTSSRYSELSRTPDNIHAYSTRLSMHPAHRALRSKRPATLFFRRWLLGINLLKLCHPNDCHHAKASSTEPSHEAEAIGAKVWSMVLLGIFILMAGLVIGTLLQDNAVPSQHSL